MINREETMKTQPLGNQTRAGQLKRVVKEGRELTDQSKRQMNTVNADTNAAGQTVLLVRGITRVMHTPEIVEGRVSGSGKSIMVHDEVSDRNVRLDASTIFAGDTEFRNSNYYEIYTPDRLRKNQRANHAPGPVVGADEISADEDLPEPTHVPETDLGDA